MNTSTPQTNNFESCLPEPCYESKLGFQNTCVVRDYGIVTTKDADTSDRLSSCSVSNCGGLSQKNKNNSSRLCVSVSNTVGYETTLAWDIYFYVSHGTEHPNYKLLYDSRYTALVNNIIELPEVLSQNEIYTKIINNVDRTVFLGKLFHNQTRYDLVVNNLIKG